jgi:hypothetical protein
MGGIQMELPSADAAVAMKKLISELLLLYQNLPRSRSATDSSTRGSFVNFAEVGNKKKNMLKIKKPKPSNPLSPTPTMKSANVFDNRLGGSINALSPPPAQRIAFKPISTSTPGVTSGGTLRGRPSLPQEEEVRNFLRRSKNIAN